MLWNYHHEFGSCLLLDRSIICKKMQQIWTFKFLEVVRQHILHVVGNVRLYIVFCWKFRSCMHRPTDELWSQTKDKITLAKFTGSVSHFAVLSAKCFCFQIIHFDKLVQLTFVLRLLLFQFLHFVWHCVVSWADKFSKEQVLRLHRLPCITDQNWWTTAAMRLTLKFLAKSLIVLVLLIFALPLFLHHLDSKEWEKMEELARARRDRAVSMICAMWLTLTLALMCCLFKFCSLMSIFKDFERSKLACLAHCLTIRMHMLLHYYTHSHSQHSAA